MYSSVNTIWVLVAAAFVFFMQAGFAMVETGFTRLKNAGNIIMKRLIDISFGTLIYWLLGFGIMFGNSSGILGVLDPMVKGDYLEILPSGVPLTAFFILQTVICITAVTLISGGVAERIKYSACCVYSLVMSGLIYPIAGHWIWGGGWLMGLGFHDFAGSAAVHTVGGLAALVGAKFLGPRVGKYDKKGISKAIPGHSLTLGALGVFILWFCWFGFNSAFAVKEAGDNTLSLIGDIFVSTNMAAVTSTVTVMLICWIRYKKTDISMTLNGSLAGLVAIGAGCDLVTPHGAALIGIIAGFVVVYSIEFIDKVLKIDDPVGVVGVHGLCGVTGTICVGFFAKESGLFYGGGTSLLVTQITGVIAVSVWVIAAMVITLYIINKTLGLRISKEEEIMGLDIKEQGLAAGYGDFSALVDITDELEGAKAAVTPIERAIPVSVIDYTKDNTDVVKMTKVVIIANMGRFEALKAAMNSIGVTGMTVTNVLGCGLQKGSTEYYRGIPLEMNLLPKVKVEIIVSKVPVELVVETAKKSLYTGNIGDGKIFVYDVENVIKVRTGEEGYAALQDDDE